MAEDEIKITIGCLLHDIGKVLYRYQDRRNHSVSGADYLLSTVNIEDKDILEQVKYHHSALLKGSGVSESSFAYISYIADNIAAAVDRREDDEEGTGFDRKIPLKSIFNKLNGNDQNMSYKCTFLNDEEISYPTDKEIVYDEIFYGKCQQNITDALKGISYSKSYVNSLLEILEGNLSFVPSSTSLKEVADISLYDHLKMTAAFGSSIYKFLKRNGIHNFKEELWKNAEAFYEKKVFLLYSMDMSGIQDFIYTISSDGALKTLRARSFYLELLMEYMADELLDRLELSRANLIYCGGGHAYILADSTDETKDRIRLFEKNMNEFFLHTFSNALYLAGGMSVCSANDFKNIPDGSYSRIFRNVSNEISEKKSMRYREEELRFLNSGYQADSVRECRVCRRVDKLGEDGICSICEALRSFSSEIQNKQFFTIIDKEESKNLLPFPDGRFLKAETENELRTRIKNKDSYVRAYCKNSMYSGTDIASKIWVGDYKNGDTFEELAESSEGVKRLGVLRADVDNLGQAFVNGFESDKYKNKFVTISRTATFSRKLSVFFKRNINKLLEEGTYWIKDKDSEQRSAAIVYSGGDDVFIIGAWDDIIGFAVDLSESLSQFSQDTLTISAGIGIYPAKYPVSAMAREVGELEEFSKSYPGKNAVTIFDETGTYSWDDFINGVIEDKYRCIADFFENCENTRGKAFLYHLLEYIRHCDDKINIARFAYTLARLEPEDDEYDKEKNKEQKRLYREFAFKMYKWIKNENDRKQMVTAIYLYVYSIREKQEG